MCIASRIRKLEKANVPEMMEIRQFYCRMGDKEQIMTALDFAYATEAEGVHGEILGVAPSLWSPINPAPDYTALNEAFEELKKDEHKDQAKKPGGNNARQ